MKICKFLREVRNLKGVKKPTLFYLNCLYLELIVPWCLAGTLCICIFSVLKIKIKYTHIYRTGLFFVVVNCLVCFLESLSFYLPKISVYFPQYALPIFFTRCHHWMFSALDKCIDRQQLKNYSEGTKWSFFR